MTISTPIVRPTVGYGGSAQPRGLRGMEFSTPIVGPTVGRRRLGAAAPTVNQ